MAVMKKGCFAIDIGFVKIGADFEETDLQCGCELYKELSNMGGATCMPMVRSLCPRPVWPNSLTGRTENEFTPT